MSRNQRGGLGTRANDVDLRGAQLDVDLIGQRGSDVGIATARETETFVIGTSMVLVPVPLDHIPFVVKGVAARVSDRAGTSDLTVALYKINRDELLPARWTARLVTSGVIEDVAGAPQVRIAVFPREVTVDRRTGVYLVGVMGSGAGAAVTGELDSIAPPFSGLKIDPGTMPAVIESHEFSTRGDAPQAPALTLLTQTGVRLSTANAGAVAAFPLPPTGNAALLGSLAAEASTLTLYCSAAGNDETGTGSATSPYRQPQRAADEIPDGAMGTVVIQLVGAGPFQDVTLRNYRSQGILAFQLWGDRSAPEWTRTSAAGATVANPDGGNKAAVLDYDVGAYATVFTSGSHWVEIVNETGYLGAVIDGDNSATPNVRLVSGQDVDYSTLGDFAAHPVVSVVECSSVSRGAVMSCTTEGQSATVVGCSFPGFVTMDGWSSFGCVLDLGGEITGQRSYHHVLSKNELVVDPVSANAYYGRTVIGGIFESGVLDIFGTVFFGPAILRWENGDNYSCYIGTHSGGGPAPGADVDIGNVDAESLDGGMIPFLFANATARFNNNSAKCSLEDCGRLLQATRGSHINVNGNVYGTTTDVPVLLESGSQAQVVGFGGGGGLMENATVAGDNVTVGIKTVDFTALPVSDVDQGDLCQMCYATDT